MDQPQASGSGLQAEENTPSAPKKPKLDQEDGKEENEDVLFDRKCQSEEHLIEIAKWINCYDVEFVLLAAELQIGELERLKFEKHESVPLNYYLLYVWKKKGESWRKLYDAMIEAKIHFDKQDFIRIIAGKDSEKHDKVIKERLDQVGTHSDDLSDITILRLAECIGQEYWYFGLRLGITEAKMEQMCINNSKECENHIRKILQRWKISSGSFEVLIRAMTLSSCDWSTILPILKGDLEAAGNGYTAASQSLNESIEDSVEQAVNAEGDVEKSGNNGLSKTMNGPTPVTGPCTPHTLDKSTNDTDEHSGSVEGDDEDKDNKGLSEAGNGYTPAPLPCTSHSLNESTEDTVEHSVSVDGDVEESGNKEELKLRDYQLELAEKAIAGKNTVIVAGTGTGKTWVALHIMKEHLDKAEPGTRKIVFMAKQCTIINQQEKRIKRLLPNYKTRLITSECKESTQLGLVKECCDILCLTPQILINNLKEGGSIKSLADFSLMIFDECHHTYKDEPYNNLMRMYMLEKEKKTQGLPQIVGLTASLGVGKSRNDEDARKHILGILANLDVQDISTVQRNKEEYEKMIIHVTEEHITMANLENDPCMEILDDAISYIEAKMKSLCLRCDKTIKEMIVEKRPPITQYQEYGKWIVDVETMLINPVEHAETSRNIRNIRACAVYLNVYNGAFEVNRLLGPWYVNKILETEHRLEAEGEDRLTSEERDLFDRLKDVLEKLKSYPKHGNQNVRKLCTVLKDVMDKKADDPRALIFVKTRATCRALTEVLEESFGDFGVHALYGKDLRGGMTGMTESNQNDTVEKFRNGDYKILVSTSVAVEGIDIPQNNCVINYNFQGNEITKKQIKGRCRSEDSRHIIIGNEKQLECEEVNVYKLEMMERALLVVQSMASEEFKRRMLAYQEKEMENYKEQKMNEDEIRNKKSTEVDYEILCKRCDTSVCMTSDIRKVGCHHIVIDPTFAEKIDTKPIPNPKTIDGFLMGFRMWCKMCPKHWGILAEKNCRTCRILTLRMFKFRNMGNQHTQPYKTWEDVPYAFKEIPIGELEKYLGENRGR